ncbi:DUF2207 domain-containing protein [Streptococcus massiliensis]|uniref:Hypothetical membrane spanning protein n=1 Tax=Streptococcus massiliensis TaxID=313439 RepID=A0A380KZK6_9STRE|nr:DUF2207 domain-containing protein [Streptococcus massiliensis]SUN76547.1 hypothetical membrane spanning protein [Streptococcus massiliensis]
MKKFLSIFLLLLSCICVGTTVRADDGPDYTIQSYKGILHLTDKNTATYEETVTYHFDSSYNGQIITLGSAGNMPTGFKILPNPQVEVAGRGKVTSEVTSLGDGYQVKVYNSGESGDTVIVTVTWQLENILFAYQDIAELNWTPISDWDQALESVVLEVKGLNSQASKLYAHTGYFGKEPLVEQNGSTFRVEFGRLDGGRKLELHGYWTIDALASDVADRSSEENLPKFQQTEEKISKRRQQLHLLFYQVFPAGLLVGLVLALILFVRFKLGIRPRVHFPDNARLYEAPDDWSPLLVAEQVYSVDMREVNPVIKAQSTLSFGNIVQATLLDLIDRKILTIEGKGREAVLVRQAGSHTASEAELALLRMAMGDENRLAIEDLFQAYDMGDLEKNSRTEERVRREGQAMVRRFEEDLGTIADAVIAEKEKLKLTSFYRELSGSEKISCQTSRLLAVIVAGLAAVISTLFYFKYHVLTWQYPLLFLLGTGLGYFIYIASATPLKDGVISDQGAEGYYHWQSFRNMLRDIAKLDKTELEGIVLWNRLLVYATLFGYAKEVSRVMKLREIHLENPDMDQFAYMNLSNSLAYSVSNLNSYGEAATSASHFSVSSGSSSISGGFSGGGGGGGGGAF